MDTLQSAVDHGSWTHYKVQWITDHGHTTKCSGSRITDTLQSGVDHGSWTHYKVEWITDTLHSVVDHGTTTVDNPALETYMSAVSLLESRE